MDKKPLPSEQQLAAYSDGYDFGFSHPHVQTHRCKNYMPSSCTETGKWIEGFRDGKLASGRAK